MMDGSSGGSEEAGSLVVATTGRGIVLYNRIFSVRGPVPTGGLWDTINATAHKN